MLEMCEWIGVKCLPRFLFLSYFFDGLGRNLLCAMIMVGGDAVSFSRQELNETFDCWLCGASSLFARRVRGMHVFSGELT